MPETLARFLCGATNQAQKCQSQAQIGCLENAIISGILIDLSPVSKDCINILNKRFLCYN
jgi:hypothetical protein